MDKIKLRFVIIQFLIVLCVAEGLSAMLNISDKAKAVISPFLFYVIGGVFLIIYLTKNDVHVLTLVGNKPTMKSIIESVFFSIVMIMFLVGISGLVLLLIYRLHPDLLINAPNNDYVIDPLFLIDRFFISFLYPVVEELIFRGVLFNLLCLKYGLKKGVILSCIVFALFHVNFAWAFVLSLFTVFMYIKKRSLFYPVIIHVINNLFVSLGYVFNDMQANYNISSIEYGRNSIILCMILLAISVPGLYTFYKRYIFASLCAFSFKGELLNAK